MSFLRKRKVTQVMQEETCNTGVTSVNDIG
jgi:hypothetical protein